LRIRSPNSRSELIETNIRQKSPASPGFFFFAWAFFFCGRVVRRTRARTIAIPVFLQPMQGDGLRNISATTLTLVINSIRFLKWQTANYESPFAEAAGLPYADDQKKTRLRSHLSA
jgi:hypothetical protein